MYFYLCINDRRLDDFRDIWHKVIKDNSNF